MSIGSNIRDKRALVLRLIVAEALAKPGEGPLAPRFRPNKRGFRSTLSEQIRAASESEEPPR